jgi:hypothetical protein
MMDFDAGRFRVTRGGAVRYDSETPAVILAPSEKITLTNYEIEFPDIYKGILWSLVNSRHPVLGTYEGAATSYIGLIGQEWGKDKEYDLADVVLGDAPDGANYLNVTLNMTNTVVPAKLAGDVPIMTNIPSGKTTRFSGQSCRIEGSGPIRRSIDVIIREDRKIVLRRYQSVRDTSGTRTRTNASPSTSNGQFWYYNPGSPGTNAGYDPVRFANVGEWLSNQSGGANSSVYLPGGSRALNYDTTSKSYRSVYKGTLEITPGRVDL